MRHFILFYDYVPDYMERRAPLRAAHFAHARQFEARGDLVIGGACTDDTGPPIAPACLPNDPSATEIEARDPVTGARGNAYLARDPDAPQPPGPPHHPPNRSTSPSAGERRAAAGS